MNANSQPLRFNFHNLVQVLVQADHPADRAFFAAEYHHHRADAAVDQLPCVKLTFRRNKLLNGYGGAGYTRHQHKLLASWGYRMAVEPGRIELDIIGNQTAVPMIHHMLVHPSLRYLSAQQGVLLLHAGAVACRGMSFILTGHGGAGKTTTTSLLLAAGGPDWRPHADDYVFAAPGPVTLAYITRSHLYRGLLPWVPEIGERISPAERLRLEIFGRLRQWSGERIKWPLRLAVERLWPDRPVEMRARIAAIILLKRVSSATTLRLRPLSAAEVPTAALLEMNFHEARYFLQLLQKGSVLPNYHAWLADWQAKEGELLAARLAETPVYQLDIPAAGPHRDNNRQDLLGSQLVEQLKPLIPVDGR